MQYHVSVVSTDGITGLWPKNSLVSFSATEAFIHLSTQDKDDCHKCYLLLQKAARKLQNLGLGDPVLVDNDYFTWNQEASIAFVMGYFAIKNKSIVTLANDDAKLALPTLAVLEWVRNTINLPANQLNPLSYATSLQQLQQLVDNKFTVEAIAGEKLVAQECIGLMTVGNSSAHKPCMYILDYNPTHNPQEPVFAGLVGKGITFDTGGLCLKPAEYMKSMHSDMGGSATVAGVIALAALQQYPKRLRAYLCCAENVIADTSMKVGDIITYPNNKSVEIANTDAEGRLVLADGLLKASKEATYVVDAATLTGAAKVALGRDYNAVLSFNRQLASQFVTASSEVYEHSWELPLEEWHQGLVCSSVADITNSASGDSLPGATCAAVFLSNFVAQQDRWIHIDLSASFQKVANEYYAVGAKGHGVRSIMQYLQKLLP